MHDAALQDATQALDVFGRPMAQIEQRALADGFPVPIALAKQDGGRRTAIGDGLDIHGAIIPNRQPKSTKISLYMATFARS